MVNYDWKFWVFVIAMMFAIFFLIDRFNVPTEKHENYTPLKNLSSHFVWGLLIVILSVIFCLGIDKFFGLNYKYNWGYFVGCFAFLAVDISYYNSHKIEILKTALDFIGFVLGSWIVLSKYPIKRVEMPGQNNHI